MNQVQGPSKRGALGHPLIMPQALVFSFAKGRMTATWPGSREDEVGDVSRRFREERGCWAGVPLLLRSQDWVADQFLPGV